MITSFSALFRTALLAVLLASAPLLAGASAAANAPLFTHLDRADWIPAEIIHGTLFVNVRINGQGPFLMLVDTGCSYSLISPEVAVAVEAPLLASGDASFATNGFGDGGSVTLVQLDTLTLGAARFSGVGAGVLPFDLQSRVTGRKVDGILGYSLFADLYFTLDFPGHSLGLSRERPRGLPPVRAEIALREAHAVPYATVAVQGRSIEVLVDSGANSGLHLSPEDASLLTWKTSPKPAGLIAVLGSAGRDWVGRLEGEAQLNNVRQAEPVTTISRGQSLIGTDWLRPFCAVFHPAEEKLWLCSANDAPLPNDPPRSVGVSLLAANAGWQIVGLIPGSPAEQANLVTGDVITKIENTPALAWSRDRLQDWLNQHASLTVAVATAAGARELTLPVWSIVP